MTKSKKKLERVLKDYKFVAKECDVWRKGKQTIIDNDIVINLTMTSEGYIALYKLFTLLQELTEVVPILDQVIYIQDRLTELTED